MAENSFFERIMQKIDKIDRDSLLNHLKQTVEAKDYYEGVFHALPFAAILLDKRSRIIDLNEEARRILGLSSSAVWKGKGLSGLTEDLDMLALISEQVRIRQFSALREIEQILPQHRSLGISIVPLLLGPLRNDEGTIIVLTDLTYLRESEREQIRKEKIESLVSLAQGVAHEIGNPLNAIIIHLKLLGRELEELPDHKRENARELLEIIRTETERLNDMVNNFLQATRRRPLQLKEQDINPVIAEAARLLEPEFSKHGVPLEVKLPAKPIRMLIDAEKIHQAIINLLKNSLHSMFGREGKVSLSVRQHEKVCVLEVEDRGRGIPEKDLPHVFEAYFTTKEEGSGLGLMIVHSIVREHGGKINIESGLNKGTKLTVLLPVRSPTRSLEEPVTDLGGE